MHSLLSVTLAVSPITEQYFIKFYDEVLGREQELVKQAKACHEFWVSPKGSDRF